MKTRLLHSALLLGLLVTGQACARIDPAAPAAIASAPAAATAAAAVPATPTPLVAATRDADPALWVIKDADTTIYLFGTVHVLKPGLSWFDEGVRKAFDASDQLVLEMVEPDPAAMQALVMKTGFTTSGPTLTQKLSEADRASYLKTLTGFGIPVGAFDRAEPWVAAVNLSLIPVLKLGYDPASGAEKILARAAKASGKPVIGLETPEQQIGYFDTLPEPVQLRYLSMTLKELPDTGRLIDEMVSDWSKGDPDALAATMNEGLRETPEVGKVLLTDRNIAWAKWIGARMEQPGTVFVAVGAGHLAGKDSVQAQLAKHRLSAVRVVY